VLFSGQSLTFTERGLHLTGKSNNDEPVGFNTEWTATDRDPPVSHAPFLLLERAAISEWPPV
jgi:hypothetical protein